MTVHGHVVRASIRGGAVASVSVWDLLVWAFRGECARLDFDEVRSEVGPAVGMEYVLMERARVGCKIDGGGRSDPHPDADIVASAVAALPQSVGGRRMALHVAEHARLGVLPGWGQDMRPRLVPVDTTTNRHGTSARTEDAARLGDKGWPNWRRPGRNGAAVVEAVKFCPCMWSPGVGAIMEARRNYQRFCLALLELRVNLRWGGMTAFQINDEMPPLSPWVQKSS